MYIYTHIYKYMYCTYIITVHILDYICTVLDDTINAKLTLSPKALLNFLS